MNKPLQKKLLHSGLRVTVFVLSLIGLSGCAMTLLDWATPNEGYQQRTSIAYGENSRQTLDIYQPLQLNNHNIAILFFYGGAWEGGEKSDYRFVAQALTDLGYPVIIPDYRVYPEAKFPEFMDDAARAFAWATQNIDQNIVVMGHSAGAHIASLLALDNQYIQRYSSEKDFISGFIGLSGPYDFLPLKSRKLKKIFYAAEHIDHTQPINYVTDNAPPTLLIHGEKDTIVYPFNSKNLAQKLRDNNVKVTEYYYPETGHALTVGSLSLPFRSQAPTLEHINSFLSSLK